MKSLPPAPAALLVALAGTALGQSTDPFPAQFQLSCLLPEYGGDGTDGFILNGIDVEDWSGGSVSSAGDVNGDGFDDVILGAPLADPDGKSGAGESFVVFGGPIMGIGGLIELSSLDGSNGFVINGSDAGDASGDAVSSAGDINGDGIDDLLIGASGGDPNGNSAAGESYVVFGAVDIGVGGVLELSSLNGINGFVLNGIDSDDRCGVSVSNTGDINGDDHDDLIIGASLADPNGILYAGESYVVFGGPGVGATGAIELSGLNGTDGYTLNGIDRPDHSGYSVSAAGDVNGDGIGDLIAGAPNARRWQIGQSYVIFGALGVGAGSAINLSSLNGANGFAINGVGDHGLSGRAVSTAGDVNGDGFGDVIIAAPFFESDGTKRAGESYVVFGAPNVGAGGIIELSGLDGTNGFSLHGVDSFDRSGVSVSGAGDVNGDGIDDLILGANFADPNGTVSAGESYVVYGRVGIGASGVFRLSTLDGVNGFVINGIDAGDRCGISVSDAGDVNGDGINDLIIGAYGADPHGNSYAGEAYVIFGRNILAPPCPGDADGSGVVDFGDITAILGAWLEVNCAVANGPGDADGSGSVDFGDITSALANWSAVCP